MHADLVALSNVWQVDVVQDALRAEHEGLVAAVKAAQTALAAATADVAATRAAADAAHSALRATNRELDEYGQKRDTTRKMIDSGAAPNYEAAERQLAKCLEIIDGLETVALEQIEAEETTAGAASAAVKVEAEAKRTLEAARVALGARDAPIRTELKAALEKRGDAWALLPTDLHAPYSELRRRKRRVLVNTVDGVCQGCQMTVGANRVNEVALGKALHVCPGCHGYVLP